VTEKPRVYTGCKTDYQRGHYGLAAGLSGGLYLVAKGPSLSNAQDGTASRYNCLENGQPDGTARRSADTDGRATKTAWQNGRSTADNFKTKTVEDHYGKLQGGRGTAA